MRNRKALAAVLYAALAFSPAAANADAVSDWNGILVEIIKEQPPPFMNRFAAIMHLAVFEGVNAVTGDYDSYLGTIPAAPGASAEAAAVAAAHGVLRSYFPNQAASLDAARDSSLAKIPNGPAKDAGIATGEMAAAEMVAKRANDGSEPIEFYQPTSSEPGEWQLTPDCPPSGGVFSHWSKVKPFVIRRADQFRADPPPALTSRKYARAYKEVKDVGGADSSERSEEMADIVQLYAAVGDAILWNPIAGQLAAAANGSLAENARMFALLNVALHDVAVALVDTKYHYAFWRPETAIRNGGADHNPRTEPDPSFKPFISTPCHPSYVSGHAATSYAVRAVLERIFGPRGHDIVVSSPALPDVTLRYSKLSDITADIDDARVYGGIHFRFDQENGEEQGGRVGAYVYKHILRPANGNSCPEQE
jgi:hypothetical protein